MESVNHPGNLIFQRILVLLLGLVAVVLFRSWGLIGYIVFVIFFCRFLADRNGVEYVYLPVKSRSSVGNLYGGLLIVLFCLSLFGAIFSYLYQDASTSIASSWNNVDILAFEPSCSRSTKFYKDGFFNCETLYWWISIASLLMPVLFALALVDMVKFSQLRARLGKWAFVISVFGGILLVLPFAFSLTLKGTSHYGYMSIISLFYLSLYLPLLFNRFSK